MINATNQFFLILQELNKAAPFEALSPSDIEKGKETIKRIRETVDFFNFTVNNIHENEILTESILNDLSQSLKRLAEDAYKLHDLFVAFSKRINYWEDTVIVGKA